MSLSFALSRHASLASHRAWRSSHSAESNHVAVKHSSVIDSFV